MTREEREEAIKVIQNFPVESTEERKAVLMAVQALEQMPVTTTTGEEGVIYYPQVEGVTPTVVKQEPCEDAISRQAALDFINNHLPFRATSEVYDAYADCVRMLGDNKALPSVTPQPKTGHWIPVSERLPEKTGLYLISIWDLVTSSSFDGHCFRTAELEIRFIPDAWMPLPKPYEPQESEDKE